MKCRKLCKSFEMNWLKVIDVAQGPQFRTPFPFSFFSLLARRLGKNSTGVKNTPLVN